MEKSEKFEARWLRILACTGAKSDSALARILGILPQSVTAARKRGQIPTGWIENISEQFDISTDWLFFGREPMRTAPPSLARQDLESGQADRTQLFSSHYAKLETQLEKSEAERREVVAENRQLHREKDALYREKEELLREVGELREKIARLEERKNRLAVATDQPEEATGAA